MGKKRTETTGTTTTGLPSWQQPYIGRGLEEASRLYSTPLRYYQGEQVAGFAPEQEEAFAGITKRAREGSPLTRQAQGLLGRTMGGEFLSPETNPLLQNQYRMLMQQSMPYLTSQAQQQGRYGSGAYGAMAGQTMADIGARVYEPERARMERAMGLAPQFAEADYSDLMKLAGVGEARRTLSQEQINALMKRWQFEQQEPWQRLGMYQDIVGDPYGTVTTSTSEARQRGGFLSRLW